MSVIEDARTFKALNSRDNPSARAEVTLSDGNLSSTIMPSGTSTGSRRALELRDGEARFGGKGVLKAVSNISENIADKITGLDAFNQTQPSTILREFGGTKNYFKLGADAVLGIPMANARAMVNSLDMPLYRYLGGTNASVLPVPMCNITDGEAHANNGVDFQEYMIMPYGFTSFKEGLRAVREIYIILKKELANGGHPTALGDESGSAPNLANNAEPIEFLMTCIKKTEYEEQVRTALDVASTEFYKDDRYHLEGRTLTSDELITCYMELYAKYPICSIEDDSAEDDSDGWIKFTEELGNKIQPMGDDLSVTNEETLKKGIEEKMASTILIKPNQVDTLTRTMRVVRLVQRNNYRRAMSHRSGGSEDTFITDFVVALNTEQIKISALAGANRTAKYNKLLEIELGNGEYLGEGL